jgi:hypothetical protein
VPRTSQREIARIREVFCGSGAQPKSGPGRRYPKRRSSEGNDGKRIPDPAHAVSEPLSSPFVLLRSCRISVTDSRSVEHAVEVIADSLFEAAALGLQVLKSDGWAEPIGASTRIQVEVREPVTKHVVGFMSTKQPPASLFVLISVPSAGMA